MLTSQVDIRRLTGSVSWKFDEFGIREWRLIDSYSNSAGWRSGGVEEWRSGVEWSGVGVGEGQTPNEARLWFGRSLSLPNHGFTE